MVTFQAIVFAIEQTALLQVLQSISFIFDDIFISISHLSECMD